MGVVIVRVGEGCTPLCMVVGWGDAGMIIRAAEDVRPYG